MIEHGSLYGWPPAKSDEADQGERCEALLARPGVLLERIVSTGQASPPDFWYDAPRDEWVILLTGAARVAIEGEPAARDLGPGDWLFLPAHCRHRVEWTAPEQPTHWLALHLEPAGTPR